MLKEETNLDWMDEPIKADRWSNLYFTKCGSSGLGKKTFNSEVDAKNHAYELKQALEMNGTYAPLPNGVCISMVKGRARHHGVETKILSHAIQIPVKS